MTLELGQLSEQVRAMGQAVASREQTTPDLLILARQSLVDHADEGASRRISIGSLLHRHGSGEAPQATSESTLGHTDDDLNENGMPVAGSLLDAGRQLVLLLAGDPTHLEGLLDEDHSIEDRAGI